MSVENQCFLSDENMLTLENCNKILEDEECMSKFCIPELIETAYRNWSLEFKNQVEDELRSHIKCVEQSPYQPRADDNVSSAVSMILNVFKAQEHIDQVKKHRHMLLRVFNRFSELVPNVTEEQIRSHDLSKFSLVEVIGYTSRWVWKYRLSTVWQEALRHHYDNNSHHPQYFASPKHMDRASLEESVLDMLACEWDYVEGCAEHVSAERLATFSTFYLERYSQEDRSEVEQLLQAIRTSKL